MIRYLKILGLALVALSAFASVAQAAEFHSEVEPTRLTVNPDGSEGTTTAHQVFTVSGSSITCKGITGEGTASAKTQATVTVEPVYHNCTFLGFIGVNVNMNGCDYTFNANGAVVIGSKAGRNCATEPINFEAEGCKIEVGAQSLTGVTYHNVGTGTTREVTVSPNVAGITATKVGGACPGGAGTVTNATYSTGNALVTGETDNATPTHVGVWWE